MAMAYEDHLRRRREDPARKEYGREWRKRNPDYHRQYNRDRKSGKTGRQPKGWGNYKADTKDSRCWAVAAGMHLGTKHRAKRRGWDFDLPKEWFAGKIRAGFCELSGLPFVLERNSPYLPSIDRIDSDKHYTPDNCRIILLILNLAKRDWAEEEFTQAFLSAADGIRRAKGKSGEPCG